ncbi:immunity 52 family protein [Luteimonas sp. SJ-92]|uniref:Immunity 52 family protein n=1 Tax=Luteimonas salinisoli TaxID=2752307 RepID=A0A853J8E0_9GAMM|nr:Imm52 family immunity protein [Luteimonas salinisoli]NZA24920.1 immunity 52 family protein [Luteimonas salinisoli]
MINASIRADIPEAGLALEAGYARVERLLQALARIVPELTHWHGGMNEPTQMPVEFSDKARMLERVRERSERNAVEFIHLKQGFDIHLASDTKPKRSPGLFELAYTPALGTITLDIHEPDTAYGVRAVQVVRDVLTAIAELEDVQFAFVNVRDRVPDKPRPTTYLVSYAAFPHRKALGWMGYVPRRVTADQLPSAAELAQVPGKGTIVVAVNEAFSLSNKAHIKQANIVEMELVDLGLLPVIDPSLL